MSKINLNSAKIIRKNKDYGSVPEAQQFFEKTRLQQLAEILFPEDEYPDGFKEVLIGLMKFQNPVQMNVWHNREVAIKNGEEVMATTWDNMCTFQRKFACAEIYQAVEVLKRATPDELWDASDCMKIYPEYDGNINVWILVYFNEVAYTKITKIANHLISVLDAIDFQVMEPIRRKINADLKIMMQIPVGQDIEYIKAKERRM